MSRSFTSRQPTHPCLSHYLSIGSHHRSPAAALSLLATATATTSFPCAQPCLGELCSGCSRCPCRWMQLLVHVGEGASTFPFASKRYQPISSPMEAAGTSWSLPCSTTHLKAGGTMKPHHAPCLLLGEEERREGTEAEVDKKQPLLIKCCARSGTDD